jgi:hypothetical protein
MELIYHHVDYYSDSKSIPLKLKVFITESSQAHICRSYAIKRCNKFTGSRKAPPTGHFQDKKRPSRQEQGISCRIRAFPFVDFADKFRQQHDLYLFLPGHVRARLNVTAVAHMDHVLCFHIREHVVQTLLRMTTSRCADPVNGKPLDVFEDGVRRFQFHRGRGELFVEPITTCIVIDCSAPLHRRERLLHELGIKNDLFLWKRMLVYRITG